MKMIFLVIGLLVTFVMIISLGKMMGKLNRDPSKIYAHLLVWTILWELFRFVISLIIRG